MTGTVCVIITARNAAETIGDAVRSALKQPEVAEVVVVDDASRDATGSVARTTAQGDPRLQVLRSETNIGPAAGRNMAIAASTAPLIAVLDADDYLLPGRFSRLLAAAEWDLIADNIVFVPASAPELVTAADLPDTAAARFRSLDLTDFVTGNLSRARGQRGELGFLKPVIARRFLDTHRLRYDEALWLGEDYDLYVRMLLAGARFRVTNSCGYAARVSATSLSGRHRTADLAALRTATAAHLAHPGLAEAASVVLRRHHRSIRDRHLLRAFLDAKSEHGPGAALGFALRPLSNLPPIAAGLFRDKLLRPRSTSGAPRVSRYLLPIDG